MTTLFGRLSWNRAIRKFRRRAPGSPIRREARDGKLKLELTRLDDRIAPGSVIASAAAQVVMLSGPLAWIGLDGAEFVPTPPAPAGSKSPAAADGDSGVWDSAPGFFSLTSPDADSLGGSANQSMLAGLDEPLPGVALNDLGDPSEPGASATGVPQPTAPPPTSGGGSGPGGASAPASATRSGGFAVSGGLPAQPPANTGGSNSPSPLRGGGGTLGSENAATPSPVSRATPSPAPSMPAPAGHFAAQLQALLHSDDSNGTFSLTDTAAQQSQIGALVGGQLTSAAGLDSGPSATHRSASLLGQTLTDGSTQNIGLRTSPSSSGPFGLVGTQSIGDLLSGPTATAGDAGGLANGAGVIAGAVPAGSALPFAIANQDAPTDATATANSDPASDGDDFGMPPPMLLPSGPPPDQATFTLTETFADPTNGGTTTLTEQGTVSFPHDWDVSSTTKALTLAFSSDLNNSNVGDLGGSDYQLASNASASGLLLGFDIDQFNLQTLGISTPAASSYTLDAAGNDSFTGSDTSTPTEQDGTVTTSTQNNYSTSGTDNFSLHIQGSGTSRQVTWNDTVNSTTGGGDSGSDADAAAAPGFDTDTFTDTSTDTHTEIDQTVGTYAPDGTFQLTSFSIDSTDDTTYSDAVNGSEGQPEAGGSESDTFTDSDSGHDHEHLTASGSADVWTASLDDTDQATFTDADTGGESSSQTTDGETDTNADTFNTADNGTYNETFHLGGGGNATTFTATSISDTIGDTDHFTDSDGGTSGDATTGETDADNYTSADTGDANETLTVTGDANNLSAGYTDTVHDGCTDSDSIAENWSGSDGNGGTDSGNGHSTDGDNGSDTVNLSANATLPNWQTVSTTNPAPAWQTTSVGATITGAAADTAGDNGTDTDVEAANHLDSDVDHYYDTSAGTDTYQVQLTGNGTTATLLPTATYNLTIHSSDDNIARWNDVGTFDGNDGPAGHYRQDDGSDDAGDIQTGTATLTVGATEALATVGTATSTVSHVTLSDTGTGLEYDDGNDEVVSKDADGIDDEETLNDSANLGEGVTIHADTTNGTTAINVDQHLNGTVGEFGYQDDQDDPDPFEPDTDEATGTLNGPISGEIVQTGSAAGGQFQAGTESGDLDLDLDGSSRDINSQTLDAPPGSGTQYPELTFNTAVGASPYLGLTVVTASADSGANVVIVQSNNVPTFHLVDDEDDAAGTWSLGDLDYDGTTVTGYSVSGNYDNGLLYAFPYDTGSASYALSDTVATTETGDAADLHGSQTVTHQVTASASGSQYVPPNDIFTDGDGYTVTESLKGAVTNTDTTVGDINAAGNSGTETVDQNASVVYHRTLVGDDQGPGGVRSSIDHYTEIGSQSSDTVASYSGGTAEFTAASGRANQFVHDFGATVFDAGDSYDTTTRSGMESWESDSLGDGGDVQSNFGWGHYFAQATSIDLTTGTVQSSSFDTPPQLGSGDQTAVAPTFAGELAADFQAAQPVSNPAPPAGQAVDYMPIGLALLIGQTPAAPDETDYRRPPPPVYTYICIGAPNVIMRGSPGYSPLPAVGATGFWESFIPIWGAGRNAIDDYQNGHYVSGITNTALAVLDIFLVGPLAKAGTKGAIWAGRKLAGETATNAEKMAAVRLLGRQGEAAANIAKNTERIPSLSGKAAYRVPDVLTETMLKEVKNVAKLSFDAQIRDSLHYAIETGRQFVLVVRAGDATRLSPQLQAAIRAGWIILENLP